MTRMAPTLQPSSNAVTTMSPSQWNYVCVLARSADQTARHQENLFESGLDEETWAQHDDCIFTQMYNNEYLYRLLDDER